MQKVSIVTVTYNCQTYIEQTLQSIIGQDYAYKEIIIIDGNSYDNTLQVIKQYYSSIDVLISERDKGIFDAMNKGINLASGDWIIFMNAGDSFVSTCSLTNIQGYLENPTIGVIYSPHILRYNKRERLINDTPFFEQRSKYRNMGFSHQSCLVRSSLAKRYMFHPGFKLSADYKMIWSLYYNENVKFVKFPDPIAVMDDNGGETVSNYKRHLIEECDICGFEPSFYRDLFVYKKYIEFRIKRIIKKLIY